MGKIHGGDIPENREPDDIAKRDEGLAPDGFKGHQTGKIPLDQWHSYAWEQGSVNYFFPFSGIWGYIMHNFSRNMLMEMVRDSGLA
jgi:hypothetical protein